MLSERRTRFANVSKPAVLLFLSAWVYQSHFTGLNPCHGEFDIDIHTAGMLCFATIDVLVVSSCSQPEVSRENGSPQKMYKVHFRCVITIWSIGIARRGFK